MLSRILDADYDIRRGSQCKMKDFEFYSKAADKDPRDVWTCSRLIPLGSNFGDHLVFEFTIAVKSGTRVNVASSIPSHTAAPSTPKPAR